MNQIFEDNFWSMTILKDTPFNVKCCTITIQEAKPKRKLFPIYLTGISPSELVLTVYIFLFNRIPIPRYYGLVLHTSK